MRGKLTWCVLGAIGLIACDSLTTAPLCACSPVPPPPTYLKATVLTAANTPAANARVVVETLASNSCDVAASGQVYGVGTADASGVLHVPLVRISSVSWCVRVTAEGAQLDQGRPSLPALVTVRANQPVMPSAPDTAALTLRLRS